MTGFRLTTATPGTDRRGKRNVVMIEAALAALDDAAPGTWAVIDDMPGGSAYSLHKRIERVYGGEVEAVTAESRRDDVDQRRRSLWIRRRVASVIVSPTPVRRPFFNYVAGQMAVGA